MRDPASFRDPSGLIFRRDGVLYRQISRAYREEYDFLLSSGLYDVLTDDRLLISHDPANIESYDAEAYLIIAPEPIQFISYPYEWSFGQLKDAALTTLEIHERALQHEMSLKDASAYNIQFHRGKPILIDTLSFERLEVFRPWMAYRQFCRHFLAPLALMSMRDPSLALLARAHIDGIPLSLASRLLPWRSRLSFPLLTHIHLHASAERRYAGADAARSTRQMSLSSHLGLVDNLRRVVSNLPPPKMHTDWESYDEFHQYNEAAFASKKEFVSRFLERVNPGQVWDLGANVGDFSRIASEQGALTIAFDYDHGAVDRNYRKVRETEEENVFPLVLDLTNPSPALGWAHKERASLLERGPADAVLALALVHHLAIGNNVPLPLLARFLRDCGQWLIIEFVPKHDPQVQKLLMNRDDIFEDYLREGFEAAFLEEFDLRESQTITGTDRMLYLMERRPQQ